MTAVVTSLVKIEKRGNVALLLIDNPPVNALSDALRADIMSALDRVETDKSLVGAVLACEGRTFIVGADITQFGKPREILTASIAARISSMDIPFVAALHGTTLGGGCEVSLGCDARVIARNGFIGLPEVKIGLVPSGGGTQRLTRLVGPLIALDLISTGRQVPAEEALTLGLIDEVADDVREAAVQLAKRLATAGHKNRIVDRTFASEEIKQFKCLAQEIKRKAGGALALCRGIEAVEFALSHTLEDGVELEQCISAEVHSEPQSHAMRYLFHAERIASGLAGQNRPATINRIVVLGKSFVAENLQRAVAQAKLGVQLLPEPPGIAEPWPEADLFVVMPEAAASVRKRIPSGKLAGSIIAIAMPFEAAPDESGSGALELRFVEPFYEHRLMHIVKREGVDTPQIASLLKWGRTIGRASIAEEAGASKVPKRMLGAARQCFDNAIQAGIPAEDIALLEPLFGLAIADSLHYENIGALLSKKLAQQALAVMVNEGAAILADGVVSNSEIIDLLLVHAAGYPSWRGGPMYEADALGLTAIIKFLEVASTDLKMPQWRPHPLLQRLALEKASFKDLKFGAPL